MLDKKRIHQSDNPKPINPGIMATAVNAYNSNDERERLTGQMKFKPNGQPLSGEK